MESFNENLNPIHHDVLLYHFLNILFMAGKNNRFGSGEISNMFDFSHGPNRPQATLTGCLGLRKFLKPTLKNP